MATHFSGEVVSTNGFTGDITGDVTGDVTGQVFGNVTEYTSSGAIALTDSFATFNTTSGSAAMTLADGTEGQFLGLSFTTDGGDLVITPANFANGTSITFADANDCASLAFDGTNWHIISNVGGTIAQAVTYGSNNYTK